MLAQGTTSFLCYVSQLEFSGPEKRCEECLPTGHDYEDELFAKPVEELRRALRLNGGQCVKLMKAIYGLAEAPRFQAAQISWTCFQTKAKP